MTKKEFRIQALLNILKIDAYLGMSEIQRHLKDHGIIVDRKSVQRDLSELISQNIVEKQGEKSSVLYKLSDSYTILKKIDIDDYFSIEYLKRNSKEIFNYDIFELLDKCNIFSGNELEYLDTLNKQFISNISKYDSQTLINKEYERIMIEFSRKSSSIEGNTYSLLSTESLLRDNIKDLTKTPEETQMILNHKDAFNEIIQNRERFLQLTIGDIEYIHSILTKKIGITKNIRKSPVRIAGTKYKPLDIEFEIKEAMKNLVKLINNKISFFEKSFLALLLISYIQPFEDGNKRTSRTLSNAILLANNSIPLSYRVIDNVEYKKATILFYEQNNISYFKELFITQVEDAVNNFFN